jgi:hypothetical protein
MKRVYLSVLVAAFVLAAAIPALAATPLPTGPEHRLTAQEIRDLAKRELLWCDDYKAQSDTCDAITLIQLAPDGHIAETTTLLISEGPRLQAFIGEVDDLTGDTVCNKVAVDKLPTAFTLEGKAVSGEASEGLRDVLIGSLTELNGKTICQSFFRGADPMQLREEVTVNGKRRTDLETVYHLREGHDGFDLRPQVGADNGKGIKV